MATFTFPAETFVVPGDPEAIAESGRAYGRFSTTTAEAAGGLRGMDSSSWVGTEGDMFRDQVGEIPPHLDTAHTAFSQASTAVGNFSEVLAAAQRQMDGVRGDAQQTFSQLQAAGNRADQLQAPTSEEAAADPQAMTAYDNVKQDLDNRISGLQADMDAHIGLANGIRARVQDASRTAGSQIRAAGRTSPTADQNFLEDWAEDAGNWLSDRIEDLKGFIAEHAGVFRVLADVLRVVGIALMAIGAIVFVASWWTGVGAAAGGLMMTAGGLIWGAGDILDTTVDWAEGKITGQELLIGAGISLGLSLIPFGVGKLAKLPPVKRFIDRTVTPAINGLATKIADWIGDRLRGGKPGPNGPLSPQEAAERAQRQRELAQDPGVGGKVTKGSLQEAHVAMELEGRGDLAGPIRRDPRASGGGDFIDANDQVWDVKGFRSETPSGQGAFKLDTAIRKVEREFGRGYNVIIDATKLNSTDLAALSARLDELGYGSRVVYYP